MDTDIVLITPHCESDIYPPHKGPPISLLCLASSVEKKGYGVKIIDAYSTLEENISVLKKLKKINPSIIGITSTSIQSKYALDLAKKIKKELDAKIIIGGIHVTSRPEFCYYDCFDYGVIGEGIITLPEIVKKIRHKKKLKRIIFGKHIKNLNNLPFPAWHLIETKNYSYFNVIGSVGCPFNCYFCSIKRPLILRNPDKIIEEMKILVEKNKFKPICFTDDIFTFNKGWVRKICKLIVKENLDFEWSCITRCDFLDKNLVKEMSKTGCTQICFGIETRPILREKLNKNLKEIFVKRAINICKKNDIETTGSFMLCTPGETLKSVLKTIEYTLKLGLNNVTYHLLSPYPATKIFDIALKEGCVDKDCWHKYEIGIGEYPVYLPKGFNIKIAKKIRKIAFRKFYLKEEFFVKKIKEIAYIRNITDIKTFLESFKKFI